MFGLRIIGTIVVVAIVLYLVWNMLRDRGGGGGGGSPSEDPSPKPERGARRPAERV